GATLGGTVSTNAAGAATFKYGTTRDWVEKFRLLLRHGEVLSLERGQYQVKPGDEIILQGKQNISFSIPSYCTPPLKKISAGYYVRNPMDLVDFFIGSEGTLGIFTEVELKLISRKKILTGLVCFSKESALLLCTQQLRDSSIQTWKTQDPQGIDIRSIEYIDGEALQLLRDSGAPQIRKVSLPESTSAVILFEMELALLWTTDKVQMDFEAVFEDSPAQDSPVLRLGKILKHFDVLEQSSFAFPEEIEKHKQLIGLREAVPMTVNEWILRQQQREPDIYKCGGDFIVPFEALESMLPFYRKTFQRYGLSYVIWGHLSDGNLHPNILPKNAEELKKGQDSFMELTQEVKARGGCPLSEHGVGKNPMKQKMLRAFYGDQSIHEMQGVKNAFDPHWTLARGVLFPPLFQKKS
ncbi:MAG: FAD-binding oxidoreductase, partial [Planctomycetota bacterium]